VGHRHIPIWSRAYDIDEISVDGPIVTSDQFVFFIDMAKSTATVGW
jgi:hypothetical protein